MDSSGNVYVTDTFARRIQVFDNNGGFITKWGITGTGDGEFKDPWGIEVDGAGDVFVVEATNSRVQKFSNPRACGSMS